MFLSDFSIKRPVAMIAIIVALMCMGLMALQQLRVNQIPDVEQPMLIVGMTYPGASPDSVEREIINRVEKALQSISGVDQIHSTASEGYAQIQVTAYRDLATMPGPDDTVLREIQIELVNRNTLSERKMRYTEIWRYDPETRNWWIAGLPDF